MTGNETKPQRDTFAFTVQLAQRSPGCSTFVAAVMRGRRFVALVTYLYLHIQHAGMLRASSRWKLRTSAPFIQAPRKGVPVRAYASVTDLKNYPQPGDQLHGFTLKRAKHVPELELTALELHHDKTGAQYLHVAREDSNNVFSIGFKTNPPDDTGVPHILEHVTLCGSEK